ncbi:MAG TPA: tetratricopeptide repeat protein [Syntrophales bacterium]|nr:tetratricopeptide repeat protein [Syntrophales bacterium]
MKKILSYIFCGICFFCTSPSVSDVKPTGWVDKGVALVMEGKYNEAINAFDKAIEQNPRDAVAYNNRGAAYGQLGNYKQQIEDSNKAIELNPEDAVAYNNRGVAHGELGDYEQEIEDCTKAIELNPNLAVAYYHRSMAYYKLGNRKQAAKDKNKAYALNPKRSWGKVEIVSSEATSPTVSKNKIKVIGNRDSKRYHLPGMKYYDKVKAYHRVIFNSEQEAINAGYHKARQ